MIPTSFVIADFVGSQRHGQYLARRALPAAWTGTAAHKLYVTSPSFTAVQSFRDVGQAVQQHAKVGYNGEVRFV